jgi:hypothetical protein
VCCSWYIVIEYIPILIAGLKRHGDITEYNPGKVEFWTTTTLLSGLVVASAVFVALLGHDFSQFYRVF